MGLLNFFKRKPSAVDIYAVINIDEPDTYIGYTASIPQALAYIQAWLRVKWAGKFQVWCNWTEGADVNSDECWKQFLAQEYVQEMLSKYSVVKFPLDAETVAMLLRMQDLCIPLNLPFISAEEREYFKHATSDVQSPTLDLINLQLTKLASGCDIVEGSDNGAK